MLTDLLKRKSHVGKVIEAAKARQRELEAEQAQAKGSLWTLEQERDRLARTVFDETARALLAEDRAPVDAEIRRLQARRPIVEAEITELTQEIIPRLERHLAEAQQALKAETLTLRHQAAIRATEGREALLKRWNASTGDLLNVASSIGRFNGRFETHQRAYRDAAAEQRQPMQPTGEGIPPLLLPALRVAMGEAWTRGYEAGEAEASANDIGL